MNRSARRFVGQAMVVGYLLAVIGVSLLHEHRSHAMGMLWSDSSIPHRSPRQDQAPLSDDRCPACQFYSAQPNLAPAPQIVCQAEIIGEVPPSVALSPTDEMPADLLARGPPVTF